MKKLLLMLVLIVPLPGYASEFHTSNEFLMYYNDITGNGKNQSSLTDGFNYMDTLTRKLQLALVLAVKAMHNFVPHFFNSFSVL